MLISKSHDCGTGLSKSNLLRRFPKVGDVRKEIPTTSGRVDLAAPEECVVVEVHPEHLYYRVRFTSTGFYECYKVPKTKRLTWEG